MRGHYPLHLKHRQQQLAQIDANGPKPIVYCALYVITKFNIMYKLKPLRLLKLSEPWLQCSCGGFLGLLTPSGVILYSFPVCVYTMCLRTWVCKLAYVLQKSTAPQQHLFWTGTAFQECRVWSIGFRKVLFSVPPFLNVPFTIIHVAYHLVRFATGIGCDGF